MAPRFDLQSHSTHSDGELRAAEVVQRAAEAGVKLLALSDHDTVGGVDEALAAGERHGVQVVPAVEISAVDDGAAANRANCTSSATASPTPTPPSRRADRVSRRPRAAHAAHGRGAARGWASSSTKTRIGGASPAGKPIGRPHLAGAVARRAGERAASGRARSIDDIGSLIRGYLIEGRPAFALRETPTVPQAVEAIHEAGGVAVWAHPFWDIDDARRGARQHRPLPALGIDGVEAFYITHTREQTELLARRCAELGLLTTGSSDFHGPRQPPVLALPGVRDLRAGADLGPIAAADSPLERQQRLSR